MAKKKQNRTDMTVETITHDDGRPDDPLNLIVEIKGYRGEDAKDKKATMETRWIPAVNNAGCFGRWAFAEFGDLFRIEADFKAKVDAAFDEMIEKVVDRRPG